MSRKAFLMFPGQGAQVVGMARDAYESGGHAKALFEEAGEVLGFDLAHMVFEGEAEILAQTENCQPALLVASLALLETLRENCQLEVEGAAGLSLGEYTALVALEAMDFADAVRLVRRRGELMEEAGRGRDTGMVSIIGLDNDVVEKVCQDASSEGLVVPANYNCPGQLAISGEKKALEKACELAKEAGAKRALMLNVSAAFHSPVMDPARKGLEEALADVPIRTPVARFINNADAKELSDPEEIRASLARQVVSPVKWEQTCRLLADLGVNECLDVGPGQVCKGLMKRVSREVNVENIDSMDTIKAFSDNS